MISVPRRGAFATAGTLAALFISSGLASPPDPLAVAFGKVPETWGAHLSPDGTRVSFLHMVEQDVPVLYTTDEEMNPRPIISSKPGKFDIRWCNWANDSRLLCGYFGIDRFRSDLIGVSRIVAVEADGSDSKVLMQKRLADEVFVQYQDRIVDWLPDDPEHVLIMVPETGGTGVGRLNIYTGSVGVVDRAYSGIRDWLSDGHGATRLRRYMSTTRDRWYYRLSDDRKWHVLAERRMDNLDTNYYPIGFGEDRDSLLVLKNHDGRLALFSEDLRDRGKETLIFAHPRVDAWGQLQLGKYKRLVAVGYVTDRPHYHFFDKRLEQITARVHELYPGQSVSIVDESWDRNVYLLHISSDQDPGKYHLLDVGTASVIGLWDKRPELKSRKLSTMEAVRYESRDGVRIPGYVTLPSGSDGKNLSTIVMPHGGPESRDVWDFDWLSQFLAARGFAVLQANFRGSGGYGEAWAGEGGFRAWRRTINDLTDGAQALIDGGVTNPERVCIVGWSYGGYAALMSAIEQPELYRCVVSIAGVTDPSTLVADYRNFLNRRSVREFIGNDEAVVRDGSPLRRAEELAAPVLLFHGTKDLNVDVKHSRKMHNALKKAKKESELVLYKDVAHSIWRNEYRIDMLGKIGAFLDLHLGSPANENSQ